MGTSSTGMLTHIHKINNSISYIQCIMHVSSSNGSPLDRQWSHSGPKRGRIQVHLATDPGGWAGLRAQINSTGQ